MKLYFATGSCGLAPQILLRETEQTFDLIKVDFKTKTTIEGNYFEVNPKGLVPVLKLDDGSVLTESAVIQQYIADSTPQRGLLPAFGTRERYRALEWLNFAATELHKGYAVLFSPLVDAASKARFIEGNLSSRLAYLDDHLASRSYVLGSELSAPDAYLFNVLGWSPRVNVDLARYPSIPAFLARMRERPSVRASMEAEGLPTA